MQMSVGKHESFKYLLKNLARDTVKTLEVLQ